MQHLLVVKFLMVMTGSWRVKMESLSNWKQSLYTCHSIVMHIYLICFVAALYLGVLPILKTDVDRLIQAFSVIILCTLILVKAYICQRKNVTEIISHIEVGEKDVDKWDTKTRSIYNKYAVYTKRISIFMFSASSMCGVTLVFTKFIVYIQQKEAAAMGLLNDTLIEKPLPYLIWRPISEKNHYIMAFLMDVLSASIGCTFNTVTQLIFISLMTYISGQLSILQTKFKRFGSDSSKVDRYLEKFMMLRELILEHKQIISFVEELDISMKYLLLVEFSINSFQITAIFYALLTLERDATIIFELTYMSCMILQIFLLAWHANDLSLQSEEISQAIYDSEWYDLPQKLKEHLLIIMMRSQRSLKIHLGPFFVLTNSTAVTSMKAAYSYLALLNNNRNREK